MSTEQVAEKSLDENYEPENIQVVGKIEEIKLGSDFVLHVEERMKELEIDAENSQESFVNFLINEIFFEKKYENFQLEKLRIINSAYDRYHIENMIERDWINFLPTTGKLNDFNIKPELSLSKHNTGLMCYNKRNLSRVSDNISQFSYCNFKMGDMGEYVGFIAQDGKLIIIYPPIPFTLKNFGLSACIEILEKILDISDIVYKNYRSFLYKDEKNDLFHNDFIAVMLSKLYMKLSDRSSYSVTDFIYHIKKIFSNFIQDEFYNRDFAKGSLNIENISYLCLNQSNMYRRMISKIMSRKKIDENRAFERGMRIGSRFNSALYEAEYVYNSDNNVWEKEVNIIPTLCMRNNILYQIPENKNKYFVKKLIFDFKKLQRRFYIEAEAYHPNINSSRNVCIGESLNNKFETILNYENSFKTECYDFLIEIEEALTVVNFDSSYWNMDKDGLNSKNLKSVDLNGKLEKVMNKSSKTLRKI